MFTHTSKPPYCATACAASASTCARSPTSVGMPLAAAPPTRRASTASATEDSEREATTTDAPSAAYACAIASPSPRVPPVITAVLPSSMPMSLLYRIEKRTSKVCRTA